MSSTLSDAPKRLPYFTLDVFTTTRYLGNQLGVVFLPLSSTLSKPEQQAVAQEFNYSETVFISSTSPSPEINVDKLNTQVCEIFNIDPATADFDPSQHTVKIWTTEQELPFAGHPTIGAGYSLLVCAAPNSTRNIPAMYDVKSGMVSVISPHKISTHKSILATRFKEVILGLGDMYDTDVPVVSIVDGMTFALLEVGNLEALAELKGAGKGHQFDFVKDSGEPLKDGVVNNFVGCYAFVRLGANTYRTRMLFGGDQEDAATGSAACTLGAYVGMQTGADAVLEITQGVEMGRKGDIEVRVNMEERTKTVKQIRLMGSAVKIMEGFITI